MSFESTLQAQIAHEYALLEALEAHLARERDALLTGDGETVAAMVEAKTPLIAALGESARQWPDTGYPGIPGGEALCRLARNVWQRNTENAALVELLMQQVQTQLDCLRGVPEMAAYGPTRGIPAGRTLGQA